MPAAGETAAAAGLVIVAGAVGGAPAGLVGGVPGGGWLKEVNARVAEQRLTISNVFIGLIGKFFPGSNSDEDLTVCLSAKRCVRVQQKTFAFLFSTFQIPVESLILFRIIRTFRM